MAGLSQPFIFQQRESSVSPHSAGNQKEQKSSITSGGSSFFEHQVLATKSSPSLSEFKSSATLQPNDPSATFRLPRSGSTPISPFRYSQFGGTDGNHTDNSPQNISPAHNSPSPAATAPTTFLSSQSLNKNSSIPSLNSSRKGSVASGSSQPGTNASAGSVVGTGTRASNYARSLNEQQRVNKEMWKRFQKFISNSRQSDSLVYARTRKEAWLHSTTLSRDPDLLELWLMMALRFLMKNQSLFSEEGRIRASSVAQPYILDVQGVMKDFWAWQIAVDYPDAMVYGIKLDPTKTSYSSQANNEGPPNYISFVGHSLAQLPFDDNFFDIVTAKSLWYLLKKFQWEFVFREILRVLKPGGVLELLCSDFTLLNKCSIDHHLFERLEQCVGDKDIEMRPSSYLAGRLDKAGFTDIYRALVALPRDWGGQIGTLTDLLSSYYMDSLVKHFSDYVPDEVLSIKGRSLMAADMGYHEAGIICLFSAIKPLA